MHRVKSNRLKKILIIVLSFLFCVNAGIILTGCKKEIREDDILKLEAEKAVVQGKHANNSKLFTVSANSKSDNITSNSKYVSNLATLGNTVTWIFRASEEGTTDIYLSVANGNEDAESFSLGEGKIFEITVNGTAVSIPKTEISAAAKYCDNWQTIKISDVALKSGFNFIVCEITEVTSAINIDYLAVDKKKLDVTEHTPNWVIKTTPATCTEDGEIHRKDEDSGFTYLFDTISATGHEYGDWHYDSESGKMVKECIHCGDKIYADVPSAFFGEVYREQTYKVRDVKTVYEAELAKIDYSVGGLNNGTSPIESQSTASGGKLVGNISKLGNFIEFEVKSSKACKSDLVLVVSNVKWTDSGIGILDPMSNYVAFTINGVSVDFSFVSLPGDENYNYYNWKYIVMKDIDLVEGSNILKFQAVDNKDSITIPNTDVLYIYTDDDCIKVSVLYDINTAEVNDDYVSEYTNKYSFTSDVSNYYYKSGNKSVGDLVITLNSDKQVANLGNILTLVHNSLSVNLEGLTLYEGANKLIIPGIEINDETNILVYTAKEGLSITDVSIYCQKELLKMLEAETDGTYDILTNSEGKTPKLIFEAEDAVFEGSASTGNPIINEVPSASGGKDVENYSVTGNKLIWNINLSEACEVDLVIRMACAKWDGSGNSNMIGLNQYIRITIDGIAVNLSGVDLKCSSATSWEDWTAVVMKTLSLSVGEHTIIMENKTNFPNTDVLYVFSENANVVITAVQTEEK